MGNGNPFESGMFSSMTFCSDGDMAALAFARSASDQVESMHAPHACMTEMHPRPRHPSERSRGKGGTAGFSVENMHAAGGDLGAPHSMPDAFEVPGFAHIGDDLNAGLAFCGDPFGFEDLAPPTFGPLMAPPSPGAANDYDHLALA